MPNGQLEVGVAGDALIEVDSDMCIGSGECVLAAPLAFALDPADDVARVLPTATGVRAEDLDDAIASCPTGAISRRAIE